MASSAPGRDCTSVVAANTITATRRVTRTAIAGLATSFLAAESTAVKPRAAAACTDTAVTRSSANVRAKRGRFAGEPRSACKGQRLAARAWAVALAGQAAAMVGAKHFAAYPAQASRLLRCPDCTAGIAAPIGFASR